MKRTFLIANAIVMLLLAAPVRAQEKVTVPFRSPGMPRTLVIDGMLGNVTVRAYSGAEALVEMSGAAAKAARTRSEIPAGMRRIGGSGAALDIVEMNNEVRITGGNMLGKSDVDIQVPAQTSVRIKSVFSGEIRVENMSGEIEVETMNGRVDIVNASGSVVTNSMNGKVTVSLASVTPDKPMSFSSMNGEIDVTLPATTKANLKMKTNRGEIYSDFDVVLTPTARTAETQTTTTTKNGRTVRLRTDGSTNGTINGGGPDYQFTTFNGNILLHKK
ncbi:MAG: DUF4097 family beta strand repeat-containing protein [Acidobacteriota bacterium]